MDRVKPEKGRFFLSWRWLVFLAVGLLVLGWWVETPGGVLGKADAIGYAVCHRIDVRSFHLGDRPLPLCARCSGMYLGALLGLGFQSWRRPRRGGSPARRLWPVLALFALAFAVDGLNSYLHLFPGAPGLYEPNNTLRLLTGSGLGVAISAVLYPAFNQSAWKDWDPRPALDGWRPFGLLLLLALGLDLVVLSGSPLALYPLALASAGGVLVLLTMIYTVLWLTLLHGENRYASLLAMVLPIAAGFGSGMAQIALLDLIRFALTGTWEGFKF